MPDCTCFRWYYGRSLFVSFRWYHGRIERDAAEKLLLESGNVDAFLVRESVAHPGDYTITVRCHDNTIMSIRVDYKVV